MTKSVTSNQNKILRELYSPSADRNEESFYFIDTHKFAGKRTDGELPVPPYDMRMGYGTGSDEEFLKSGLKTEVDPIYWTKIGYC